VRVGHGHADPGRAFPLGRVIDDSLPAPFDPAGVGFVGIGERIAVLVPGLHPDLRGLPRVDKLRAARYLDNLGWVVDGIPCNGLPVCPHCQVLELLPGLGVNLYPVSPGSHMGRKPAGLADPEGHDLDAR